MKEYQVNIDWDDEEDRWGAIGQNVSVAFDAGSLDALIEKVKLVIWDLTGNNNFRIQFKMERVVEASFG